MKSIVIYYSYEGNTKLIAEAISAAIGADIQRLTLVKEMTYQGFRKYLWGGKQVFMKEKPKLEPLAYDLLDYDVIFLGTPVWSWTFAPAIRSLVESGLLHDKKVYFFCTHEGGLKNVEARSKALIEKRNTWLGFKDFMNVSKDKEARTSEAASWAKSLNISEK